MPFIIKGPGGTSWVIDSDGRGASLLGTNPEEAAEVSTVAAVAVPDRGRWTGEIEALDFDINRDYAVRIAVDQPLFQDNFVGDALNYNLWKTTGQNMTAEVNGDFLILNANDSTVSADYLNITSYKTHALYGSASLYVQFRIATVNGNSLNKVLEVGAAYATGKDAITDGAVFRWHSDGRLYGVLVNNGVESAPVPLNGGEAPLDGETHLYYLVVTYSGVSFWIDDEKHAEILAPSGWDSAVHGGSLPTLIRAYNSGTVSNAAEFLVSEHQVIQGGMMMGRKASVSLCQMGQHALQGQTGFAALGQTTQWRNSAAPVLAALSNTDPGYMALGGLYGFEVPDGAETDYALFAYQSPAGSVAVSGKQLMVSGVRVDSVNTVVNNSTPVVLIWAAGIGATDVSLATEDGEAAKEPRRVALGVQSWAATAPLGTVPPPLDINFDQPVPVNPSEYIHIIVRVISGTSSSAPTIRGTVQVRGYWE
jgi:hypothetical protein